MFFALLAVCISGVSFSASRTPLPAYLTCHPSMIWDGVREAIFSSVIELPEKNLLLCAPTPAVDKYLYHVYTMQLEKIIESLAAQHTFATYCEHGEAHWHDFSPCVYGLVNIIACFASRKLAVKQEGKSSSLMIYYF